MRGSGGTSCDIAGGVHDSSQLQLHYKGSLRLSAGLRSDNAGQEPWQNAAELLVISDACAQDLLRQRDAETQAEVAEARRRLEEAHDQLDHFQKLAEDAQVCSHGRYTSRAG